VTRQSRLIRQGPGSGQPPRAGVNALAAAVIALVAMTALALFPGGAAAQEVAGAAPEYRLLPGDEIAVKMPLNPELDTQGPVGPDGRFSIPYVGRVAVAGLTVGDAETAIAEALHAGRLVENARPGIVVSKYTGVIYVGGEVKAPGPIPLTQALNPLQAIVSAGGLLDSARSKKVVIVRQAASAAHKIETVDIRRIIKTGGAGAPLALAPGDVVFVPKSTIAEVGLFIDQYVNAIVPRQLYFNVNLRNAINGSNADKASTTPAP